MSIKVPENVVELLALEDRYMQAKIFVDQSDNDKEVEKAYRFIDECEEAFKNCKVKFEF